MKKELDLKLPSFIEIRKVELIEVNGGGVIIPIGHYMDDNSISSSPSALDKAISFIGGFFSELL